MRIKKICFLLFVLISVVLIKEFNMGLFNKLFGSLNSARAQASQEFSHKNLDLIYRISWFELQISPDVFRLAAIPQQPILLYKEPESEEKGSVMLVDKNRTLTGYETIYERLDRLVAKFGIIDLPQRQPEKCFNDAELKKPGVHLRIRYADDRQWASVYPMDNVPSQISELINECRQLTKDVFAWGGKQITGEQAKDSLKEAEQAKDKENLNVIIKVNIKLNGDVYLNGKPVSWEDLIVVLDGLVKERGVVWYSRENPESNPGPELDKKIKAVLDEIVKRKLPIRLLEKESE